IRKWAKIPVNGVDYRTETYDRAWLDRTKTGFILSDTDDTHTTEEYSRRNGEEGYTGKKISVSFQEERFLGLANREAPEATIRAIRKPEEENPLVIGERIFSHFIEDSDAKLGKIRESPPDLLVL